MPLQPAPEPSHGREGAQRVGEALAAPDVHVAVQEVRPLEPAQGDELPVGVGGVGQGRGPPPGPTVDAGPAGRTDKTQEGRGPAAVVGDGGHVQPGRPQAAERLPGVPSAIRQPGVVVQVGVDQPRAGEQPGAAAGPPGVVAFGALGWWWHAGTISRASLRGRTTPSEPRPPCDKGLPTTASRLLGDLVLGVASAVVVVGVSPGLLGTSGMEAASGFVGGRLGWTVIGASHCRDAGSFGRWVRRCRAAAGRLGWEGSWTCPQTNRHGR